MFGREFVEVYRDASLRSCRRLKWVQGKLMGTLHQRGVESKVHPRTLICISQDYTTFRKCLVVIDRECGLTPPVNISLSQRGRRWSEIRVKGAFTIGRGERSELLAFLIRLFRRVCYASAAEGHVCDWYNGHSYLPQKSWPRTFAFINGITVSMRSMTLVKVM